MRVLGPCCTILESLSQFGIPCPKPRLAFKDLLSAWTQQYVHCKIVIIYIILFAFDIRMKILPIHGNVHCSHALVCNHPKTALMSSYLVLFFSLCKWQKFYLRFLHNPNLPSLPNTRLGPNWLASLVRAPCFMNMILWSLHGSLIESPFLGDAAPFYYLNLKGNWWRFFIYIQN